MEGVEERREKFDRAVNLGVSRDLPENFTNRSSFAGGSDRERKEDDEEIELSLGLSMNGRFGLDPAAKRLKRSSSVSNLISTVDFFDSGSSSRRRGSYAPLARTSSLPAVNDELRRRKEMNSLKYTEARKKRMEKLKNGRVVKDKDSSSEYTHTGTGLNDDANEVDPKQASQGSASAGSSAGSSSSSSGISDFQGQILDGTKTISSNVRSASHQLPQDEAAQKPSSKVDNKTLKNPLLDMPYVSTRGDGPNGTKIEGFLYRYRKGDEVKIVCVCHGEFLTPAEFVKHGGGGDVAQPLKHIVVNPFPLF